MSEITAKPELVQTRNNRSASAIAVPIHLREANKG